MTEATTNGTIDILFDGDGICHYWMSLKPYRRICLSALKWCAVRRVTTYVINIPATPAIIQSSKKWCILYVFRLLQGAVVWKLDLLICLPLESTVIWWVIMGILLCCGTVARFVADTFRRFIDLRRIYMIEALILSPGRTIWNVVSQKNFW